MSYYYTSLLIALWFGILTSISPCPLGTNIIAISYIIKQLNNPKLSVLAAIFYTLGRSLAYIVLAITVIYSLFTVPAISDFLQTYLNLIIGPLLIFIGMIITDLIEIKSSKIPSLKKFDKIMKNTGFWGAGLLGMLFALAFCPISAAIFFGSLIPLAIKQNSIFLIPLFYGIGTALPIIIIALTIVFGTNFITGSFRKIILIDKVLRLTTGLIFILAGIYFCIIYLIL